MAIQTRRIKEKLEYMSLAGSKDFFKKGDASLVGIQAYTSSYGNYKLLRNMSNHGTDVGRDIQGYNVLIHDLIYRKSTIAIARLAIKAKP